MKQQELCEDVFREKYAKANETTREQVFQRVAIGLAEAEKPEDREKVAAMFFDNMMNGAIGAGRIMSAAGTGIAATLANCFVQPVGDCIQGYDKSGTPGIYDALRMSAETMRRGGGVGYNFSRIRPKNAKVKGTQSEASGPCSYINVFDKSCETVESYGARRGAQMAILNINHPDIFDFVTAKRTKDRWNNFNVSIGVVDGFMEVLEANGTWQLVHEAEPADSLIEAGAYKRGDGLWVYRELPASEIWDVVMKSTYDFAEPGVVFLGNMNRDNNLRHYEVIEATNPCGEQPLPAYGCCDLGPSNLTRYVLDPFTERARFDFDAYEKTVRIQVRMLDNVLIVSLWPLDEQRKEAEQKRRIGVGFTGLGDALVMLGLRYDSDAGRDMAAKIAEVQRNAAYRASIDLAKERGPFPLFDADKYLEDGTFASRLPDDIKDDIRKYGIRNSHLTSIAPTGTVSLAFCDNASNGIEPAFSWAYTRTKRMPDGSKQDYAVEDHALRVYLDQFGSENERNAAIAAAVRAALAKNDTIADVRDYGEIVQIKEFLPEAFVSALEMSAIDHLKMMQAVQPFVDSAISKTVNIPEDYPFDDFKGLYLQAWKAGLKGLATYRPNKTRGAVLSVAPAAEAARIEAPAQPRPAPKRLGSKVYDCDPLKAVIEKRPVGRLPAYNEKVEYYTQGDRKVIHISMSFMPVTGMLNGEEVTIIRPIEVFVTAAEDVEQPQWIASNMMLLSQAARNGTLPDALRYMQKATWDKGPVRCGTKIKLDGSVAPETHSSDTAAIGYALKRILVEEYGFLDPDGNQVPTRVLAKRASDWGLHNMNYSAMETQRTPEYPADMQHGKKCSDCGAHAVVKRDGCEVCTVCHHVGSCG